MAENTNKNRNIYENARIYIITDNAYTAKYIGSTVQPLSSRMAAHRALYRRWKDGVCKSTSICDLFDNYGVENCKIELLEEYPCENKNQMMRREGFHIQNEICINKNVAGRTYKEYWEENKERILQQHKEYRKNNKEKVRECIQKSNKKYRLNHLDEIRERELRYRTLNKYILNAKSRDYRNNNLEKCLSLNRDYYQHNKDMILQYKKEYRESKKDWLSEKIPCETCGKSLCREYMSKHIKRMHSETLNNLE